MCAEASGIPQVRKQFATNHIFEQHVQTIIVFRIPESVGNERRKKERKKKHVERVDISILVYPKGDGMAGVCLTRGRHYIAFSKKKHSAFDRQTRKWNLFLIDFHGWLALWYMRRTRTHNASSTQPKLAVFHAKTQVL